MNELFRRLRRDESGVSTILFAGSAVALLGASAVATDLGSLYLAKRKLQGLADAAAMTVSESDFVTNSPATVGELIVKDGSQNVRIIRLQPGVYTADPTLAGKDRFQPVTATEANAMKVSLEQTVPLFFGKLLTGNQTATVHAEAIASRVNMAAFSIGTQLTNIDAGLTNQLLSAIAGSQLNLDSSDLAALTDNRIDILAMADSLAARTGTTGALYQDIMDASYDLTDVIGAMRDAGAGSAASVLQQIEDSLGAQTVDLTGLIDLGPMGETNFRDPHQPLMIDAYSMMRAALQLSQGSTYQAQIAVNVAGLTNTTLTIAGKNGTEHSPMLTVTAARDVVVRTAATRIYLDAQIGGAGALASLRVPFYAELAPGEARMTAIECGGREDDGVTLGVKPSIGSAAIGTVDISLIEDFSAPLTVSPARVVSTLLARIDVSSNFALSGDDEQSVLFTLEEIADHESKSVSSSDIMTSLSRSLVSNASVSVTALGLGLSTGPLTTAVGTALTAVAPTIDTVLDSVLKAAGVQLGVSQVTVDKVRCGAPILVA
jgi:uncharacterized membrane protein